MNPSDSALSRREALLALSAGGVFLSSPQDAAPAFAGKHAILPLPFDPKSLQGLSEKLLVSHHDNNYAGAVKNLNKVEAELARVTKDTPGFVVSGLKERELMYRNSKTLHEHYFANLGGDGKLTGPVKAALDKAYGDAARWEEHFRAVGMSLAGGSGWAVLGYDVCADSLYTCWQGNHTQSQASSVPLLVMDMYEHAFHIDFGASAAKYVDAVLANVRYEEVNRRFERAVKAAAALRG